MGERVIASKVAPDISHLSRDDIIAIIKANTESEIAVIRALTENYVQQIGEVLKLRFPDEDKLAEMVDKIPMPRYDGGCGCSAGCC